MRITDLESRFHLDESLESEVVSSQLEQFDQLCQVNPVRVDQSDLATHNFREGEAEDGPVMKLSDAEQGTVA
jgi:hypothetical protein